VVAGGRHRVGVTGELLDGEDVHVGIEQPGDQRPA
jgi:hypothetical protein